MATQSLLLNLVILYQLLFKLLNSTFNKYLRAKSCH